MKNLNKASNDAKKLITQYRCFYEKEILICEGGGKDNICKRAKEISEILNLKNIDFQVYILLDGDAKNINCNIGWMFYLNEKNLDELIFVTAKEVLSKFTHAKQLLENEENSDSKLKTYLVMYLFKKHLAQNETWTDLSSFSFYVAVNFKQYVLSRDQNLCNLIKLLDS
ncbi:hypothetical protein D1867_12020 [Acidianus infernus]|uniref:DUF4435 domain-containing protein n=1 Tax=Acidianus infernus TaxID=12915 RepID=A0A6A9QF62_ACIIN|nr:hypothetical protein [Acidianus infernus]MUM65942.1 hypothetical protein [Acidianus infernus]